MNKNSNGYSNPNIRTFSDDSDIANYYLHLMKNSTKKNCEISYFPSGKIREKRFYNNNGELQSDDDNPAFVEYDEHTQLPIREHWYKNGNLHREHDKPAIMEYNDGQKLVFEVWYINGKEQRDNGKPSSVKL